MTHATSSHKMGAQRRLERVATAARHLPVHRNTLSRWVQEGRIPHYRIGAATFVDVEELAAMLTVPIVGRPTRAAETPRT